MIGGRDIVIPISDGPEALDVAVRAVYRMWPGVILEDGESGEVLGRYADITFAGRKEILAFRDAEAAGKWATEGVRAGLEGTLLHFIVSPGELTVVVDDPTPLEVEAFVTGLRRSLRQDLFASGASAEAA